MKGFNSVVSNRVIRVVSLLQNGPKQSHKGPQVKLLLSNSNLGEGVLQKVS